MVDQSNYLEILESTERLTSDRTLELADVAYTAQILQKVANLDSRVFSLTLTNSSQVGKVISLCVSFVLHTQ